MSRSGACSNCHRQRRRLNAFKFSSSSDKVLVSFPKNVNVPPHIRDRSKKYCWHCERIHVTLCPPLPAQLLKSSALRADGPELHCKPTPAGAPPQEAVAREDSGTGTWWHLAPEVKKKHQNKTKEKNTLGWCDKPDKQITKIDFIGLLGQWTRENPQPGYWTFILQSSPISKNYTLMCKEVNPCICKPKIILQMCVEKVAGDWLSRFNSRLVSDDWNH